MTELIKKLVGETAASGREKDFIELIRNEIGKYASDIYTDALGNLCARKAGNGKKLMLTTHTDSAGFFATHIDELGRISVAPIGRMKPTHAAYRTVIFENGTRGVLLPRAGACGEALEKAENYYIDIGATCRSDVESAIGIGDISVCEGYVKDLGADRLVGMPLGDRIGCAIMIELLKSIKENENDLYFVFTAQSQVGARGALPCAADIRPDAVISLDPIEADDENASRVKLGGGAVIRLRDGNTVCDEEMCDSLREICRADGITHQLGFSSEAFETGAFQRAAHGAVCGAVCIPIRGLYTAAETVDMSDVTACAKLINKAISIKF